MVHVFFHVVFTSSSSFHVGPPNMVFYLNMVFLSSFALESLLVSKKIFRARERPDIWVRD